MRHAHHTAALITAAGLSSRMHDFKPLLPLGKETISRLLIRKLREAGVCPILVVTGHRAEELVSHLGHLDLQFVHNNDYKTTEMFDSLCIGLRTLNEQPDEAFDRILITPVDIPCVLPATIERLMESDAAITIPTFHGKKGHPVCMDRELIASVLSHSGEDGLRGALSALTVQKSLAETEDPGILADADTEEDYESLKRLFTTIENPT